MADDVRDEIGANARGRRYSAERIDCYCVAAMAALTPATATFSRFKFSGIR